MSTVASVTSVSSGPRSLAGLWACLLMAIIVGGQARGRTSGDGSSHRTGGGCGEGEGGGGGGCAAGGAVAAGAGGVATLKLCAAGSKVTTTAVSVGSTAAKVGV